MAPGTRVRASRLDPAPRPAPPKPPRIVIVRGIYTHGFLPVEGPAGAQGVRGPLRLVSRADRRYKVLADVKRRMTINDQDTDPSTPAARRTPELAAPDTHRSSPIPRRGPEAPGPTP